MINAFDVDVAQDVGITAAVLYKNIQYWCEKNRTNEQNEHDGLYWTYNSIKAYCEQFPYMNEKQIRRALACLEEKGYIKSGRFNDTGRDRTKWYADLRSIKNNIEADKMGACICPNGQMETDKTDTCICPNGQMHSPELANASAQMGEPLPNNYQITTTNKKKVSKKESNGDSACAREKELSFDEILDSVEVIKENTELREAFINFIKMRKVIKAQLTNRGLQLAINTAYKIAGGNPDIMTAVVNQSVERSWRGIFPLTDSTIEPKTTPVKTSANPYTDMLKAEGYI